MVNIYKITLKHLFGIKLGLTEKVFGQTAALYQHQYPEKIKPSSKKELPLRYSHILAEGTHGSLTAEANAVAAWLKLSNTHNTVETVKSVRVSVGSMTAVGWLDWQ